MKRSLIITIGIVIILLVLGVWVYLLLFGTPEQSEEVFTNLGFEIEQRDVTIIEPPAEDGYSVDVSSGLQQLTTRPVAGFTAIATASSSVVRYVEQGTGHIYEIDLLSGNEEVISRTTLPRVRDAVFSADGSKVALTSVDANGHYLYFGSIDSEETSIQGNGWEEPIPDVQNVGLVKDSVFSYTKNSGDEQIGYTLNVGDDSSTYREVFRIPFQDTKVIWRPSETFVYNSAAETLLGYLYEIKKGTFYTADLHGFSLVTEISDDYIGFQKYEDEKNTSGFINRQTNEEFGAAIQIIPEKCDFSELAPDIIWCADELVTNDIFSVTDWYQGKTVRSDRLWEVSIPLSSAALRVDLEAVSGRPIDVIDLTITNEDSLILFMNKYDNTLWKYNIQ